MLSQVVLLYAILGQVRPGCQVRPGSTIIGQVIPGSVSLGKVSPV